MKSTKFRIFVSFFATVSMVLPLLACGKLGPDPDSSVEQNYSFDGVKLITPTITKSNDPQAYSRNQYTISPTSRLLMRFEDLGSHSNDIRIGTDRRVRVQIAVVNIADIVIARETLKLCPLVNQWMMLATWNLRHPFGQDGKWSAEGSDFDPAGCVSPVTVDNNLTKRDTVSPILTFDMTDWFVNYARGRNQNYGLVLIAEKSVTICGDANGSYSPRILWDEVVEHRYQ